MTIKPTKYTLPLGTPKVVFKKYTLATFNKYLKEKYHGLCLVQGRDYLYWADFDYADHKLRNYIHTRYTTSVMVAKFAHFTEAQWKAEADTFMKDFQAYSDDYGLKAPKETHTTQAQERCEIKRQLRLAGVPFDTEAKLEDLLKLLNFVTKKSNGIIEWRKDAQELPPKVAPNTTLGVLALRVPKEDQALSHDVYEACETIDAALFTGDEFEVNPPAVAALEHYLGRWQRALKEAKKPKPDNSFDDDNGYCRD
jgi:hypothetical protein